MDDFFITEYEFSLPANTFTKDMAEFRFWSTDPNTNYISHSNQNYSYIDQDPVILLDGGVANYLRLKSSIDTTTGTPYLGSVLGWTFDAEIEKTLYAQWAYNKYKVVFEPGSEQAAGSMQEYVVPYSESFKIPDPSYYWFKHKVTGWNAKVTNQHGQSYYPGEIKSRYELNETIPENAITDSRACYTVTLTPIWEPIDTTAQANNGEFEITLRDGEKAIFDDIPAGTEVEIYEKTPEGWKLVSPVDNIVEGTVKPNEYDPNAVFTNRKKLTFECEAPFEAQKVLNDAEGNAKELSGGEFLFQLLDSEGQLVQTARNDADGKVTFDAEGFNDEGTYTYTIKERIPEGAKPQDDGTYVLDGLVYDATEHTATVVVTRSEEDEDGNTTLSAEVTYDGGSAEAPTFTNNEIPEEVPETHTLKVTKVAEGIKEDQNPTFTFEVTITDGRGIPISGTFGDYTFDSNGKSTVTIEGSGSVDITGLPEGTLYSVAEVDVPRGWAQVDPGNAGGTLDADEEASFTSEATVTNKYESSGLAQLKAYKALEGGEVQEGQFTFGLWGSDDPACEGEPLQTKQNGVVDTNEKINVDGQLVDNPAYGKATVNFDPITIEDEGTYTYYIREIAGDVPTVTYDTETIITATVVARDTKNNGTLDVEVSSNWILEINWLPTEENRIQRETLVYP